MSEHDVSIILFGMFGGLSLNIIRLLLASLNPKQHRITFDLAYWLQFIGLTVSGGVVALARHEPSRKSFDAHRFNLYWPFTSCSFQACRRAIDRLRKK
jgi:hypothetical protein